MAATMRWVRAADEGGSRDKRWLAAIGTADWRRRTTIASQKSFRQPILKNVNGPAHDKKAIMVVITTGKTNLAFAFHCVSVLGNNQNCLASSTACLFPASMMSTARPSQVCSTVRVTTTAERLYEPQPKFNVAAEIFEAWLEEDSFKAGPRRFVRARYATKGLINGLINGP